MRWPRVTKRERHLSSWMKWGVGQENMQKNYVPNRRKVQPEVWGGSVYMEGSGASLRSSWSGLHDEETGGKEERPWEASLHYASWATVRTLYFIWGIVGAWALFYRQSSVEGFGAREWQNNMIWAVVLGEWFSNLRKRRKSHIEASYLILINQGSSGRSGSESPETQPSSPSFSCLSQRPHRTLRTLSIREVAGPGVQDGNKL